MAKVPDRGKGAPHASRHDDAPGRAAVIVSMTDAARDLARQKRKRNDPPPDQPRGGALAGKWTPNALGLPNEDRCPVIPLGKMGDTYYFIDAVGQFVERKKMDADAIHALFDAAPNYLKWAWPHWGKPKKRGDGEPDVVPIDGFEHVKARESLRLACARRGLFNPRDKLRGLGMWTLPGGQLIYHAGEELWTYDYARQRPVPMETGLHGGHLYPRLPALPAPWSEAIKPEENPAGRLITVYRSWNWRRPDVDPMLLLGHNCVGYLGGALAWRPAVLLLGDKGTGKSALQSCLQMLFGDAVFPTSNTTAAGIYQDMAHDNRLVAVDELEPGADQRKVDDLVALMRIAASGAFARRGGADGAPTSYQLRCAFLFSAINNPLHLSQDISRVAILRLMPLPAARASAPPVIEDTAGRRLLTVVMREWPRFADTFEAYRAILAGAGHDARGQDTYGTLLALAELALGELAEALELHTSADGGFWHDALGVDALPEMESGVPNWRGCLSHALTTPVDLWRGGARQTVGQRLEALRESESASLIGDGETYDRATCRRELADVGLGLLHVNDVIASKCRAAGLDAERAAGALGLLDDGGGVVPGYVLAVPHRHAALNRLFRDSPWANGAWSEALRQCPHPGIMITDKDVNRVTIGGEQLRCTLVVLDRYRAAPER